MSPCDEQLLSLYHDGELAAADRARVESHLRECPACARQLELMRDASRLLRDYPFQDITERERADLHEYIDEAADRPIWRIGGTLGIVAASILVIGLAWLNAIPATTARPVTGTVAAAPESWERVAMTLRPDPQTLIMSTDQIQNQIQLADNWTDLTLAGLTQGPSH
jgi:anti-sigma factor RsiW